MYPQKVDFWRSIVEPRLQRVAKIASDLAVAVVVCRRGSTPSASNFKGHNIETRFYTDMETEDFLLALREVGISIFPFYREDDFMRWVIDGCDQLHGKRLFAYSSGASVPGVGAKALLPAFCALHAIDVMGPDPHVASLARHKFHAMTLLRSAGVPVPATQLFVPGSGWLDGIRPRTGVTVIVKPSHEAASIGVDAHSILRCDDGIDAAVADRAEMFRQSMTVQEFVRGREVEVPVFVFERTYFTPVAVGLSLQGDQDLGDRFLDYETVSLDRYGFYAYAAPDATKRDRLFDCAKRAAAILGIRDFGRIDFRIDETGQPWAIDVSTSPYISSHSSFAFAARESGGSPARLSLALLAACCNRMGLVP